MSITNTWEQTRCELVIRLAALPSKGDVMEWQRHLAAAIIDAENPPSDVAKAEAKRHRHLLRVIGDGLVHELLDEHTIRALSRHPGKPASLSGQGEDFDFVLEQASLLHGHGVIPIVADLTTLIGIGDLIGRTAGGDIMVLECKNRTAPQRNPTNGRLARQRQRGENLETYLATSTTNEGDLVREALNMALPSPDWTSVSELLQSCEHSPIGVATHSFGTNDVLVATTSGAAPEQVVALVSEHIDVPNPAIVFYSELIETASYRLMAPSSYPISGEQRWRLLEGELQLIRFIDMHSLSAAFNHDGTSITLAPELDAGRFRLRIDADGQEYASFTHQLAEFCAWMPVPLAAMREALSEHARALVAARNNPAETASGFKLAAGDNVKYATLYRPD